MVALLAALNLSTASSQPGTMPAAAYRVKSDLVDEKSAGGYALSTNASWSMKDVAIEAKGMAIVVKKNACCMTGGGSCPMIVALVNATAETVWFLAEDSRIDLGREAKDRLGAWRPNEFRAPSDCGNSRHKVALTSGRVWTWDVPSDTGNFATKCRYVLWGLEKPVYSAEFDARIDPGTFLLPDEWAKGFKLREDGRLSGQ